MIDTAKAEDRLTRLLVTALGPDHEAVADVMTLRFALKEREEQASGQDEYVARLEGAITDSGYEVVRGDDPLSSEWRIAPTAGVKS